MAQKFLLCALAALALNAPVAFAEPAGRDAAVQEFDQYFKKRLDAELAALKIDLQQLEKERRDIAALADGETALSAAREFYKRYQPYYEQALLNMQLAPDAIRAAFIDANRSSDPAELLSIVRYSYSCGSPLTVGLCNLLYPRGCTLQTLRPGQFNIFPRRETSARYAFDGNANGFLFMREDNIEPNAYRHVGATIDSQNSQRMCIQARGRINDLFVSTSSDFFLSAVFSLAYVRFLVAPVTPPQFDLLEGTAYIAYRSEGLTNFRWESEPESRVDFGQTLPHRPYLVQDEVWVTPLAPNQRLSATYMGSMVQGYDLGASATSRISFTLDEIQVLRIAR